MNLPTNDDEILLLHNDRCSKSRATKAMLEQRGIRFVERNYLQDKLSREELDEVAKRLARPVREWIRQGEDAFTQAGIANLSNEQALLTAIAAHPVLMERPIVIRGNRAVVGRPIENVLTLLSDAT